MLPSATSVSVCVCVSEPIHMYMHGCVSTSIDVCACPYMGVCVKMPAVYIYRDMLRM